MKGISVPREAACPETRRTRGLAFSFKESDARGKLRADMEMGESRDGEEWFCETQRPFGDNSYTAVDARRGIVQSHQESTPASPKASREALPQHVIVAR